MLDKGVSNFFTLLEAVALLCFFKFSKISMIPSKRCKILICPYLFIVLDQGRDGAEVEDEQSPQHL